LDEVRARHPERVSSRDLLVSALAQLARRRLDGGDAAGAQAATERALGVLLPAIAALPSHPLLRSQLRGLRKLAAEAAVAQRDAGRAVPAAKELAAVAESSGDRYAAAVAFAGCVGLLGGDPASRADADACAREAVVQLRGALAAGRTDPLGDDERLAPLRGGVEFEELVREQRRR
jgi:hypothetical protein